MLNNVGKQSELLLEQIQKYPTLEDWWYNSIVWPVFKMAIPQCIYMLGHGFHQPCGQGGAVGPFPDCAGRAAAWSGFLITASAFIVGQLISHSAVKASQTLVLTMLSLAILLATLSWLAIPRAYVERTLTLV